MTTDSIERNDDFGRLIQKSNLEIPDIDFEDKVMDKVLIASMRKQNKKKDLRLSWIFLIASCILFPLSYFSLREINWEGISLIGDQIGNLSKTISMAGIVIYCIVVLYQLDNLFRLTFRQKLI